MKIILFVKLLFHLKINFFSEKIRSFRRTNRETGQMRRGTPRLYEAARPCGSTFNFINLMNFMNFVVCLRRFFAKVK